MFVVFNTTVSWGKVSVILTPRQEGPGYPDAHYNKAYNKQQHNLKFKNCYLDEKTKNKHKTLCQGKFRGTPLSVLQIRRVWQLKMGFETVL